MNFYKGNNILNNKNLSAYLQGVYYDKRGNKIPLEKGTNKYNYEFLMQTKELIYNYSCLLRLDFCVKHIVESMGAENTDVYNMWHIITAQTGTVRFLRTLSKALKTYKIQYSSILNAIKKDLEQTTERYERNLEYLKMFMQDYGLTDFIKYVEDIKKVSIFEDIFNFFNNNCIDITGDNDKEIYDKYDEMYIQYIYKTCKEHGIALEEEMSQKVKTHLQYRKKVAEEVKQLKEAKKEKEKEENGKIVVSKFYHAVNDALLSGGNSDFRDVIIARFVDKLKLCGNVGYFVVIAHKSTVYYLTEDKTETSSLNKVKLFATEEEANKFCLEYESKYYKEVVSLSIGKKEKAVNFDITDELKKYAYYLNQAINYKYTSVHIADRAILRIRQKLKEDSDKCYYIMNKEYKFYDGQKFSNIWDVHLYKKEELNGINVKELGYIYKFTLDSKVTDLYLDKKFYIYLEKGFKTSFIEQHLIEQNLTQGYYVVSWNEKEGTHSYLSYLNTFDSNSDKMKIFKNKPEIKSENDIYYKVVPCNVSENKVKETLENYKQGTKELFYKYKVKGYVIVTNDMSIIGPIKVLTEQGTFNKIDNRQKIKWNTILTFSSAEQAEEYWNSLIKKKPTMYKRTHRVYRVC